MKLEVGMEFITVALSRSLILSYIQESDHLASILLVLGRLGGLFGLTERRRRDLRRFSHDR